MPCPRTRPDVLALADAKAYPQVHLGAHRALAHGFLRGPLSSGYQRDGYGGTKWGGGITLFGFCHGEVRHSTGSNTPKPDKTELSLLEEQLPTVEVILL